MDTARVIQFPPQAELREVGVPKVDYTLFEVEKNGNIRTYKELPIETLHYIEKFCAVSGESVKDVIKNL